MPRRKRCIWTKGGVGEYVKRIKVIGGSWMRKRTRIRQVMFQTVAIAALSVSLPACAQERQVAALEKLAEKRNAKALYHLGMMYLTGTSVEEDQQRAVAYFREAAELGEPLASYKIGCFYDGQYDLIEPDDDLALKHKLVAAEAGYALAQQDVAGLYYRREDIGNAMQWLERAVAQGTSDSLSTYASIHNGAPGISKDPVKTAAYFKLFLQRVEASDTQLKWLRDFEAKMTDAERQRAAETVRNYKPQPTVLTLEALSGARAVDALIQSSS